MGCGIIFIMQYSCFLPVKQETLHSTPVSWSLSGDIADSPAGGSLTSRCSCRDYGGASGGGGCFVLSGQIMGPLFNEKEM